MPFRRAALPAVCCLFALLGTSAAASSDEAGALPPDPAPPGSDAAIGQDAPPAPVVVAVERGDTLMALLLDVGLAATEAHALAAAIAEHLPPRALRPGQEIVVVPDPVDPGRARTAEIIPDATRRILVTRTEAGYAATVEETEQVRHLVRTEGEIRSSLYEDMAEAGVPPGLVMGLIRAFSHAVDFQRDLQPGDRFAVMFERFRDPDGALIQHGQGIYAELRLRDRAVRIWRHAPAGGSPDWFDETGESVRRGLLRTPLDAARISSGYGMRRHPILGYSRMHQGIDFAAPSGTPVYAAGEGTVSFAGWRGGHGRVVMVRHNGGITTLYAHLSSIPRGIQPGVRVRQAQVIGRVGSTGMSTGPHLHYEVHRGTAAVNPSTIRTLAGRNLQGRELAAFRAERARIERQFAALAGVAELAAAD